MKVYKLVDDIDGKTKAVESVRFGIDGSQYEIDLSAVNAKKFHRVIDEYIQAAHRPRNSGRPVRRRTDGRRTSRDRSREIRAWAQGRGYQVKDRGRVPESIVAEYDEAH